jgi:hypothetical protein
MSSWSAFCCAAAEAFWARSYSRAAIFVSRSACLTARFSFLSLARDKGESLAIFVSKVLLLIVIYLEFGNWKAEAGRRKLEGRSQESESELSTIHYPLLKDILVRPKHVVIPEGYSNGRRWESAECGVRIAELGKQRVNRRDAKRAEADMQKPAL